MSVLTIDTIVLGSTTFDGVRRLERVSVTARARAGPETATVVFHLCGDVRADNAARRVVAIVSKLLDAPVRLDPVTQAELERSISSLLDS
jgi:hypothetical protein